MEIAMTLLQAAVGLLLLVNAQGASVSEELRIQATEVANYAVTVAQIEIARQEAQKPLSTSSKNDMNEEPVSGGNDAGMVDGEAVTSNASQPEIVVKSLGRNQLDDTFNVGDIIEIGVILYDAEGEINRTSGVTMATPDEGQNKTKGYANTKKGNSEDWYYSFEYAPATIGDHNLKFSGNGLNGSVTIKVQ